MSRHEDMQDPDSVDWLGLRWSAWMPLMAAHPLALGQLPSGPGLYRIRRTGASNEVCWVGPAPAGVRATVERLSRQIHLPVQPYDDPNTPALDLWQEMVNGAIQFTVSGAHAHSDSLHDLARTASGMRNRLALMHRTSSDR